MAQANTRMAATAARVEVVMITLAAKTRAGLKLLPRHGTARLALYQASGVETYVFGFARKVT